VSEPGRPNALQRWWTGQPAPAQAPTSEPPFDPTSWGGAIIVMLGFTAALWIVQIFNSHDHYGFNRFGLRPRQTGGLWGVLTQPFLHTGNAQLISNTFPVLIIGWTLLLSGVRVWLFVTASVVVVGGFAAWLVAPSGLIVGASALVFGWMGYLVARAVFSRKFTWIVTAIAILIFFGALFGQLVPNYSSAASWQSNLCGFVVGAAVGWLLHPRRSSRRGRAPRRRVVS